MMTTRVLVAGPELTPVAMRFAADHGVEITSMKPYATPAEMAAAAREADAHAIIVRMGKVTAEVIGASPSLKVVVKHGVGVDGIDVDAATRRGVPVLITAGANSQSVAEHALALIFSVARSTALLDRRMREGAWDKATHTGVEIFGKTLGVVGLGSIGRILIDLLRPLHMQVLVYDPFLAGGDSLPEGARLATFEEVLAESDVLSLHCPLTDETRGMLGARELGRMRRTALLINTARGELVDEAALADALQSGRLAGAGLDTFAMEPPAVDSPLWSLPNLVATPHVGANTQASRDRMGLMALGHILDVMAGRPIEPRALVNPSVLDAA